MHETAKFEDLVLQNGLYQKKYTKYFFVTFLLPFTGRATGLVADGELRYGAPDGPWITYHENFGKGVLGDNGWINCDGEFGEGERGPVRSKGLYKDGKKEGLWEFFYYHGQLEKKITYEAGLAEGPTVEYHKNGQLHFQAEAKHDKYEGPRISYYDNGRKHCEEHFKNGKNEGSKVVFDRGGRVLQEGVFKDGSKQGRWYHYDTYEGSAYNIDYQDGVSVNRVLIFDKLLEELIDENSIN